MEPPQKIARIRELRGAVPYVSQRAMAAILNQITHDDVESKFDRNMIRKARDTPASVATPYGSLHQQLLIEDVNVKIEVQHPLAMMHHLAATSPSFSRLLARTASACPSVPDKPWKVLIYFDEVGCTVRNHVNTH